ncbi:ATP-binding region ATPase domain protein [Isosphaera pallida ATCC 43644]|uniref:ATP-binding region ATPase domain protein n=1 Tax=Isosphaera pallida (strain ATCC 43644 / DSM 9630 / IS1B) TaxID=575540 RepID=E8QWC9_ISOPI|nr:HSP90 family protein [Isosphaera pallida]ADV60816.1 ATP-binding region ATPase domain protein [Isosphaera pallida ATCC 43644]
MNTFSPSQSPRNFQINLHGIIELLSGHLYSGPQVFVRELLQNAVDALTARTQLDPSWPTGEAGRITLEVWNPRAARPTLVVRDDGIGLTEQEVHTFLATIGLSSKRDEANWDDPTDFIGRFGIGLLSCFVVSEEIVVITKSAKPSPPRPGEITPRANVGVEWRGRSDGTYTVRTLDPESDAALEIGTKVFLTCKPGSEEFFCTNRLIELARDYGSLLPYRIEVIAEGARERATRINPEPPPWRQIYARPEERDQALLAYGRSVFGIDFIDVIPLRAEAGEVDGVAFVLPFSPSLASKRTHRVYLKRMLLSEQADNLLPEWAFFVKCVANANRLKPTASRERFHENADLANARDELGACLKKYLVRLANRDPQRLRRIVELHYLSIKALAIRDDEFYRLVIDWLPFETSMGRMTLTEYRRREESDTLKYVANLDQFRQIAPVAAAQGICLINAAYTYDLDLVERFPDIVPEGRVEAIDADDLARSFDELEPDELDRASTLLDVAEVILRPFRCLPQVKRFLPVEMPALYSLSAEAEFLRSLERTKEVANSLWSSVLDGIAPGDEEIHARLRFNYDNPLIRCLIELNHRPTLEKVVPILYVQSLLMSHRPLKADELALLNTGLSDLIVWGLEPRSPQCSRETA